MFIEGTKIYKSEVIYNEIKDCLENNLPFAICRMGNAEISTIAGRGLSHMRSITQGIPESNIIELLDLLKHSANNCNYVSSMGAWLTEEFFEKNIKKDSIYRQWESIYKEFGITNTQYCNPDIGYLIFLEGKLNLWNLIKDKRICLITSKYSAWEKMYKQGISCSILQVTPQTVRQEYKKDMKIPLCGRWHWEEYEKMKKCINVYMDDGYDIFLIGAGYLGKGYSEYIKSIGGISFDVGKVMDTWNGEGMGRMVDWMEESNDFSFKLTEKGKQYDGKI